MEGPMRPADRTPEQGPATAGDRDKAPGVAAQTAAERGMAEQGFASARSLDLSGGRLVFRAEGDRRYVDPF